MPQQSILEVREYFDGELFHTAGPYYILMGNGICHSVIPSRVGTQGNLPEAFRSHDIPRSSAAFAMPTLAEAHCHVFLDGDELDSELRSAYLKESRDAMLTVARRNLVKYREAGVTLLRDAGDIHGINLAVREIAGEEGITMLCAGEGLRRAKRYGGFMAREVGDNLAQTVREITRQADVIKIILTGIIDFAGGTVKGTPQFTVEETRQIVDTAHELGKKTFAHCSGEEGLRVAVAAGVDSIEHGFFMTAEILEEMSRRDLAWTPTLLPVEFQWRQPHYGGWDEETRGRLRGILDNHAECLRYAEKIGVKILAGSDGGSFGVKHGSGLREELLLLRETGLAPETVLASATSRARTHMGVRGGVIQPGEPADYLLLPASPREDISVLAPAAPKLECVDCMSA